MKEHSPAFKIIQAVNVPGDKSSPRRGIIVIVFTFLGGVAAVGWILIRRLNENFRKN